ncbi:MAG: outer membrane beta-barrel protein [Colwellia sp.]|nr:outer membrane beta-barrel protein [Colwellia sp.]
MRFLLLFFICYSSLSLSATVSSSRDSLNGEFSFSEGNLLLTEIQASYSQVGNFLRSDNNKQKSTAFELSPELFIQTQGDGSLFQLQAKASYFTFDDFSRDDHYDFSVLSKFHLKFAESQKMFLTASIADTYEYRGTGLSLGRPESLDEGDTKRNEFLNIGYLYGHQDSLARVKLLAGYRDFAYLTRKNVTKRLAYSSSYLQGNFDYLITGNTYLSTKIQYENFSYEQNADLERKQYLALAGLKWHSTELTQLHLLFGYEKALFSNDAFGDKNRFAWQVNMLWNPLKRIEFKFTSGSEITDSYKIVKSVNFSNYYGIGLRYDFNERLLFNVSGKVANGDVVGIKNKTEEKRVTMTTRAQYQWRYWLSAFVQMSYEKFDSTIERNQYDLQTVSVGVVVTF